MLFILTTLLKYKKIFLPQKYILLGYFFLLKAVEELFLKGDIMTQLLDIYKCHTCKNVVEITHQGFGALVCCAADMEKLQENTPQEDNAHFAHIENIDELEKRITFNHPMTEEHHIEYIEVISNDKKYIKRKYLKKDETPELKFKCECKEGYYVRIYCNLDGVWTTK